MLGEERRANRMWLGRDVRGGIGQPLDYGGPGSAGTQDLHH